MTKAREIAELGAVYDSGALSNRNLIINGAMEVAQRGTSTTSSGYLIDRFTFSLAGVGVTRSQDTDVPSGQGFSNSLKHLNTSTSTATGAYCASQHHIEAQDIRNSGWDYTNPDSYITVSFWAKSSIDGTYYMTLRTYDGTSYEYCAPYTLTANTWKRVDFQIAGNSNLTFNNDNGQGITLFPFIEMGSDFTDSTVMLEDQWVAYVGTAQTPDKQSSFMSTSGAAFWYTGVQLEVGPEATPFEHRSYGDELQRCKRYYRRISTTDSSSHLAFAYGLNYLSTIFLGGLNLSPEMRTVPSFSTNVFNDTSLVVVRNNNTSTVSAMAITGTGASVRLNATSSSLTAGDGAYLQLNDAGSYVDFDAEL